MTWGFMGLTMFERGRAGQATTGDCRVYRTRDGTVKCDIRNQSQMFAFAWRSRRKLSWNELPRDHASYYGVPLWQTIGCVLEHQ